MSDNDTVDIFGVILEEEKMIFAILIIAIIIFFLVLINSITNAIQRCKQNDKKRKNRFDSDDGKFINKILLANAAISQITK
jgi:hypothetical protein